LIRKFALIYRGLLLLASLILRCLLVVIRTKVNFDCDKKWRSLKLFFYVLLKRADGRCKMPDYTVWCKSAFTAVSTGCRGAGTIFCMEPGGLRVFQHAGFVVSGQFVSEFSGADDFEFIAVGKQFHDQVARDIHIQADAEFFAVVEEDNL
jgi:hypothetical protein